MTFQLLSDFWLDIDTFTSLLQANLQIASKNKLDLNKLFSKIEK